jgi:hypothetical protein
MNVTMKARWGKQMFAVFLLGGRPSCDGGSLSNTEPFARIFVLVVTGNRGKCLSAHQSFDLKGCSGYIRIGSYLEEIKRQGWLMATRRSKNPDMNQ